MVDSLQLDCHRRDLRARMIAFIVVEFAEGLCQAHSCAQAIRIPDCISSNIFEVRFDLV